MNITEASLVNRVLGYWLELDSPPIAGASEEQAAVAAMAALAARAHRALGSGLSSDRVLTRWDELYGTKPGPRAAEEHESHTGPAAPA